MFVSGLGLNFFLCIVAGDLKRENQTLKWEINELRDTNTKMKKSLEEAVRSCRPQIAKQGLKSAQPEAVSLNSSIIELQEKLRQRDEQLDKTVQLLSETRKQLSEVRERQTVSELVTEATQKRKLQEEGVVYENLPSASIYEKLRPVETKEHVYATLPPTTLKGCHYHINDSRVELWMLGQPTIFSDFLMSDD